MAKQKANSNKSGDRYDLLPLDVLEPHPCNSKEFRNHEVDVELSDLADSIDALGQIHPILVRKSTRSEGKYEIIAGERRFLAVKKNKEDRIAAVVRELSEAEALMTMAAENFIRKRMNPVQAARLLKYLCKPIRKGGAGLTRKQAALYLGRQESSWVSNIEVILELDQYWLDAIEDDALPMGLARPILKLKEKSPESLKEFRDYWEKARKGVCDRTKKALVKKADEILERYESNGSLPAHTTEEDRQNQISFDIAKSQLTIGDHSYNLQRFQLEMLKALHEASQTTYPWRTGNELKQLPGCISKTPSKVFSKIKEQVPYLADRILSANTGFRLEL